MRPLIALLAAFLLMGATCKPAPFPPPDTADFPNATNTGADESVALTARSTDLTVTTPGTTIQNMRFTNGANLWIRAINVTIKNSVFEGGRLNNHDGSNKIVYNGMVVDHVTFENIPGQRHNTTSEHIYYRLGDAGYVANAIKILYQQEGFRLGGADHGGTQAVIMNSYVLIDTYGDAKWNGSRWVADEGTNHVNYQSVTSPNNAPCDGHPDGVQGYVGPTMILLHNTFDLSHYGPGTCNDAGIFIADGSLGGDVVNNAVEGGGYSIRLHENGHYRVFGNRVQRGSWGYAPLNCQYGIITSQGDNYVADLTYPGYHTTALYQAISC